MRMGGSKVWMVNYCSGFHDIAAPASIDRVPFGSLDQTKHDWTLEMHVGAKNGLCVTPRSVADSQCLTFFTLFHLQLTTCMRSHHDTPIAITLPIPSCMHHSFSVYVFASLMTALLFLIQSVPVSNKWMIHKWGWWKHVLHTYRVAYWLLVSFRALTNAFAYCRGWPAMSFSG